MRPIARLLIALAALAPTAAAVAQTSPWSSGTYLYDGAGNISAIGTDYYVYDAVGRLTRGSADKQRSGADSYQTYTYDKYGNRLTVSTTGTTCAGGCGVNLDVNDFNHIKTTSHGASYDGAGNLTQFDGFQYTYDPVQLMSRMRLPNTAVDSQYIYTADDERLATFTGSNHWQFTVRDLDGKILREVTATEGAPTSWSWDRDHVFRDGQLLATVLPSSVVHYHLDHLGSPRLVTGNGGVKLGVHAYYPFGGELSLGLGEAATERLKFTGHERDDNGGYGNALDYMHARYYGAGMGRFSSVDPTWDSADLGKPQSWNRYDYTLNNPINRTDPDGKCPICVLVVAGVVGGMFLSGDIANAPAPGDEIYPSPGPGGVIAGAGKGIAIAQGIRSAISQFLSSDDSPSPQQPSVERRRGTAGGERAGKPFTAKGKQEIHQRNADAHGGANECEGCGTRVEPAQKSQKGVTPPDNERHADHIVPKSQGGDGSPSNGQTLCRKCNLDKSDKIPPPR